MFMIGALSKASKFTGLVKQIKFQSIPIKSLFIQIM